LYSAPITTFQSASGITLYIANLIGLLPHQTVTFHPALAFTPKWQLYRIPMSFLVQTGSIAELFNHSVGLFLWQAPLEVAFTSKPASKKGIIEHIKTNKFLHAQLIASTTLIAIELVLYRQPKTTGIWLTIFPYSLFPSLEYSMRWLWAATETKTSIPVLGVVPVPPIYTPVIACAISGFGGVQSMVKGLAAAIVVGWVMEIKRSDGKLVVKWLKEVGQSWVDFGMGLYKRKQITVGPKDSDLSPDDEDHKMLGPLPAAALGTALSTFVQIAASFGVGNSLSGGFGGNAGFGGPSLSLG